MLGEKSGVPAAVKAELGFFLPRVCTSMFSSRFLTKSLSQQEQRLKELAKKPHTSLTTAASPVSTSAGGVMTAPAIDMFSTPSSSNRYSGDKGYLSLIV